MDNFDLRSFLTENKLTTNSKQLEEGAIQNLVAATLMSLGIAGGVKGQEAPKTVQDTNPITWQQMTQPQKAAVKAALVAKGGLQLFLKYKDSISTDATNRREGEIDRAASEMGMTRAQYEKWYEKQKRKPDQSCGDLNISGANKRGEKKGSCSTGQSMGGDSLKDIR
jgi:hypothetical protein